MCVRVLGLPERCADTTKLMSTVPPEGPKKGVVSSASVPEEAGEPREQE